MTEGKHHEKLLGTRRDLLADPLSIQVHACMRQIYLEPSGKFPRSVAKTTLSGMVSALKPSTKRDGKLGAALQSVSKFISKPVDSEYVKAFEAIKRPNASLLGTFISVVYARALRLLSASASDETHIITEVKELLTSPSAIIEKYNAAQGKLDERFIGHLVTMSEVETHLDPHFQIVLERCEQSFIATHRPNEDSRNPLADPGSRLDLLSENDDAAWWVLPTVVAFGMTVWDQHA
jgi:hypothetical protein